ncbi:hypothetical protein [Frigoribacterium sp. MCBA15_019]|uniref:hypothetical protein n=1 Tax=Frigoribacterium sp. MCBA15_019 TaxID=1898745 RepID=UPI0008DE989B|nr:hypothetical protein [Frigoribacterium sp. MCBA15_019]OII27538.1 hypothetical protein BIV04_03105 [Frigoribacterium sp. MCBA15_019]
MPTPADRLAALRDGGAYRPPRDPRRPCQERLEDNGLGLTVEYPSPLVLAETFARPLLETGRRLYRDRAAILASTGGTPAPITHATLVTELRAALEALPDRADAGRPYADVRRLLAAGSTPKVDAYLADTVRALCWRDVLPEWTPPREAKPAGPPRTSAQVRADHRARIRGDEEASARWWLTNADGEGFLAEPGERIGAVELAEQAAAALGELASTGEHLDPEDDKSPPALVPRRRVLLAVATEVFGRPRRDRHGARYYVVPSGQLSEPHSARL